jgi:hypothetical protein
MHRTGKSGGISLGHPSVLTLALHVHVIMVAWDANSVNELARVGDNPPGLPDPNTLGFGPARNEPKHATIEVDREKLMSCAKLDDPLVLPVLAVSRPFHGNEVPGALQAHVSNEH